MKIYTKTGDKGTTALFGGKRVSKDDTRVEAYGDIDELNAILGVCLADLKHDDLRSLLIQIQNDLFAVGAQLANPSKKKQKEKSRFTGEKIEYLETSIDRYEEELPPMKDFILPGGHTSSARLHFARTLCRRAERQMVHLMRTEEVDPLILVYLNRLSDLLFVLARVTNKRAGLHDTPWVGTD